MYKTMKIPFLLGLLGLAGLAQANPPIPTYYSIQPMHHDNLCVGVRDRWTHNSAVVDQYECNGGDNRLWVFESSNDSGQPVSNGVLQTGHTYRIKNVNSDKYISIKDEGKGDSETVWQWHNRGSNNQLFELIELTTTSGKTGYQLQAKHSGKCLSVPGSSTKNRKELKQYSCKSNNHSNRDKQIFDIKIARFGTYSIQSKAHANTCLSLPENDSELTSPLRGLDCNNPSHNKWKLVVLDDNVSPISYRLINDLNDRCMGVDHSRKENGAQLTQWNCRGTENQIFELRPKLNLTTLVDDYQLVAKDSRKCVVFDNNPDLTYNVFQHDCDDSDQKANSLFSLDWSNSGEGSELTLPRSNRSDLTAGFNIVHYPNGGVDVHSPITLIQEPKCLMGPSLDKIEGRQYNQGNQNNVWDIDVVDCQSSHDGRWIVDNYNDFGMNEQKLRYITGHGNEERTLCMHYNHDLVDNPADKYFGVIELRDCDPNPFGPQAVGIIPLTPQSDSGLEKVELINHTHSPNPQDIIYYLRIHGDNSDELKIESLYNTNSGKNDGPSFFYQRTFYLTPYTQ